MPATKQTIETTRGTIAYRDYRAAQPNITPLLLVHGAGGSHLDWPVQLRRHQHAHAIALDLPGHGASPGAGRTTIDDYAADVVALLDALALDKVIVAGHSMGGAIAQTLALDYGNRLQGLILVGTGANLVVNERILNGIRAEPQATAEQIMMWAWAKTTDDKTRQLAVQRLLETSPDVTYGDYVACNAFDVRHRLHEIQLPTLVIGGTVDKMTPPRWSDELATTIANAQQLMIEGGGHMFPLEQPEQVAEAIVGWTQTVR